ncbi:hypothetical protein MTX78_10405 [Hymenobacter tibetensis]|uniref:Peptidase A2 domain-containing protein n=1 Tax=Hymenobacter tibetensis TaxID=497967 RepID=A0ABY4D4N4_9BACT|nr:hypothetical protein [Hymenobacter tibetensis]UOG76992.1 hypothetical protein MTX78_10405 [Hymenobacter tibetensis]
MKLLFKILLSVLVLLLVSGIGGYFYMRKKFEPPLNQLVVTQLPATCTFAWHADSSAQPVVAHAAMLVPVRIPNCPRTCYMQFDTGAPYSVLYTEPLAALRTRYPATTQALLPAADAVKNFRFALGAGQVQAGSIRVLKMGVRDLPADESVPFVIGTLGSDILENRALVVDYATRQFRLSASVPESLARRAVFAPLDYTNRSVLLSMHLQGKDEQLFFDSGSSAFSLLTSQKEWKKMARPSAPVRTTAVNSWGKTLTSYTAPTAATVQVGTTAMPLRTVTYIEGMSMLQTLMMRFSGLGGMLGNEVFAERTIVLDVKGGRFGVVQ